MEVYAYTWTNGPTCTPSTDDPARAEGIPSEAETLISADEVRHRRTMTCALQHHLVHGAQASSRTPATFEGIQQQGTVQKLGPQRTPEAAPTNSPRPEVKSTNERRTPAAANSRRQQTCDPNRKTPTGLWQPQAVGRRTHQRGQAVRKNTDQTTPRRTPAENKSQREQRRPKARQLITRPIRRSTPAITDRNEAAADSYRQNTFDPAEQPAFSSY